MISKQFKSPKKRPAPTVKPQPEVDKDFEEEVDHEANMHSPQVNDFRTMEPFSGQPPEMPSSLTESKKKKEADNITVDDISYMLSRHPEVDTSDIVIQVEGGEVILTGSVPQERMKFMAAEIIKLIHGVRSVNNQLRHEVTQ